MDSKEAALSGTEYTKMYWGADYLLAGVVFLYRSTSLVEVILHGQPYDVQKIFMSGLSLVYCFLPLILGVAFRKLLKRELDRELLSTRTYLICNWRIAQLLFIVYIGMMLFGRSF